MIGLFVRNRQANIDAPQDIFIINLDATISENHTSSYNITRHPVESGVSISDHKRREPLRITIEGIITNTPLELLNFDPSDCERPQDTWETFQDLQASDNLLTVFTTLQSYENMQIQSVSAVRDAQNGNALRFTAQLEEVFIVETTTVEQQSLSRPPRKDLQRRAKKARGPSTKLNALADSSSSNVGGL